MKGNRKGGGKANQPDVPIVYDSCGVDVNDPIGNHLVNFKFSVLSEDDPEKPFDGDVDMIFPHNLPKNLKPPKIEVHMGDKPWESTLPIMIDDNFLNQIREKRFIYKIVFLYKTTSHGKGPARGAPKRNQDKSAPSVTNHTFFVDLSCLLVRGGRFKPFQIVDKKCSPPGFRWFNFIVEIDHPILSDAQIRRYQPFVVFLKGVHQLPNTPISFEELASKCVGPYLVVRAGPNQSYTTFPQKHGPEMKLNIALIFWGQQQLAAGSEITIELRDRESDIPSDMSLTIGSSFVIPPDPNKKPSVVEPLSIDQILGGKKEATSRPFGVVTFPIGNGRMLLPFKPVLTRDSLMQPGFYVENGTYLTVEMESMKDHVPNLPIPVQPATPINQKRGGGGSAAAHNAKQPPQAEVKKICFFNRVLIVCKLAGMDDNERLLVNQIQEKIVIVNAVSFKVKDLAAVPSMKITQEDSTAISGFYLMSGDIHIIILEVLDKSDNSSQLQNFLNNIGNTPHITVLSDFTTNFKSPRLYGSFDCAVKKFKLGEPLDRLLAEPNIYVQNSHLSNCFNVLNQLNQLQLSTKFPEIDVSKLWPKAQDLEMLNAKKGVLLSMEELSFPPRPPKSSGRKSEGENEQQKEETQKMEFIYHPINEDMIISPPHNLEYFIKKNAEHITDLNKKNRRVKGLVGVSEDGEVEIWNLSKGSPDDYSETVNSKNGENESKNGENESKNGENESKNGENESKNGENESKNGENESKNGENESKNKKQKGKNNQNSTKTVTRSLDDTNKNKSQWTTETPESHVPLAQSVGVEYFTKNLRKEDGTEIRDGRKFYSYKSAQSFLPPIEQLKADVNNEPWLNGDNSLAASDQRWINDARGPVYTSYNPYVQARGDAFDSFHPISIDEEFKQPKLPGCDDRVYETKAANHAARFKGVLPQFKKDQNILLGAPETTPLSIQEEYHDPLINVKNQVDLKMGQKKFRTVFPDCPLKKGNTDNPVVKKITFTFPPVKPGF